MSDSLTRTSESPRNASPAVLTPATPSLIPPPRQNLTLSLFMSLSLPLEESVLPEAGHDLQVENINTVLARHGLSARVESLGTMSLTADATDEQGITTRTHRYNSDGTPNTTTSKIHIGPSEFENLYRITTILPGDPKPRLLGVLPKEMAIEVAQMYQKGYFHELPEDMLPFTP